MNPLLEVGSKKSSAPSAPSSEDKPLCPPADDQALARRRCPLRRPKITPATGMLHVDHRVFIDRPQRESSKREELTNNEPTGMIYVLCTL